MTEPGLQGLTGRESWGEEKRSTRRANEPPVLRERGRLILGMSGRRGPLRGRHASQPELIPHPVRCCSPQQNQYLKTFFFSFSHFPSLLPPSHLPSYSLSSLSLSLTLSFSLSLSPSSAPWWPVPGAAAPATLGREKMRTVPGCQTRLRSPLFTEKLHSTPHIKLPLRLRPGFRNTSAAKQRHPRKKEQRQNKKRTRKPSLADLNKDIQWASPV